MPPLELSTIGKVKNTLDDHEVRRICAEYRKRISTLHSFTKNPKVSIIIPAFNEKEYILATIRALSHLKTHNSIEIIWVDNGSTDGTGDIMKECGIKVIQEKRKWTSYARQTGLEAAQWDFIFTTDADTLVPPTWVEKSLKYFHQYTNLVFLSGWHTQTGTHWSYQSAKCLLNIYKRMAGKDYKNSSCFSGANSIFPRNIANMVGGYEAWVDKWEDILLARKISRHGEILWVAHDKDIQVQTSWRRFSSIWKVMRHAFGWTPGWTPVDTKEFWKATFQDIR